MTIGDACLHTLTSNPPKPSSPVLRRSQFSTGRHSGVLADSLGKSAVPPISSLYQIPKNFPGRCNGDYDRYRGVGCNKLQINPAYLTRSTQAMLHKALRLMKGVGFVECVELNGGF